MYDIAVNTYLVSIRQLLSLESRGKAHALVSWARRGGDSRHFILKIKLNCRHSDPTISSSLLWESRRDENLSYFPWSTVRLRTYFDISNRRVIV